MIKINGETWQILLVSPNHPALRTPQGSYTLGCCDDNVKTIFISNDLQPRYLKKVLCHELVHAFMYSNNVNLSYEQEEVVADIIATYGENIINTTNFISSRIKQK